MDLMNLMVVDVVRFLFVAVYGVGVAFMLVTNVLAFKVLRPPNKVGFLWWHITSISVSFVCLGLVALDRAVTRIGEAPTWRTYVTGVGLALFGVAQVIIFNVERTRYVQVKAQQVKDLVIHDLVEHKLKGEQ